MSGGRGFKRIVIAVGDSEDEINIVPVVIDVAQAFGSEVLVVHLRERIVAAAGTLEAETIPDAMAFGKHVAERLSQAGINTTFEVHGTSPDRVGNDVLKMAREFGADLIVIGPHHQHGLKQRLFGDIGKTLAHGSSAAVLLLPSLAVEDAHPAPTGEHSAS